MTNIEVNKSVIAEYGIPMELNNGDAVLETVDIKLTPDEFPRLECTYLMMKKGKQKYAVEATYNRLWWDRYKELRGKGIDIDMSSRYATMHAIENAWRVYNEKAR